MDLLTLTICSVTSGAMMAITLVSLYLTNRCDRAMRDWALAGICFFLSNLVIMLSGFYDLPWLVSPVLANTIYITAHGLILSGITHQTRNLSAYGTVALFAAAVFLLQFVPAISENVAYRILSIAPIMLALNVLSLMHLWYFRKSAAGKGYWAAICVLGLFILFTSVNLTLVVAYPSRLAFFGDHIVQTANVLATMLYIASITLGVIFIQAWKREVTLKTISRTDALSGWFNRHALNEFAHREFARSQRNSTAFAFIIFDVDHFKKVNDTYGHIVGDRALKHVANVAKEATRDYDYHFRLGGEEFVIMLSGLKISDIKVVSERVRHAIQLTPFEAEESSVRLSVSLGIAAMDPGDLDWHVVLERADKALYRAKKGGRNKSEFYMSQKLSLVKA